MLNDVYVSPYVTLVITTLLRETPYFTEFKASLRKEKLPIKLREFRDVKIPKKKKKGWLITKETQHYYCHFVSKKTEKQEI